MKKLFMFILLMGFFNLEIKLFGETTTEIVYVCCSPENFCGSRLFADRASCTQACPGHNSCQARSANISRIASPTSQVIPAISMLGSTPVAIAGTSVGTGTGVAGVPTTGTSGTIAGMQSGAGSAMGVSASPTAMTVGASPIGSVLHTPPTP